VRRVGNPYAGQYTAAFSPFFVYPQRLSVAEAPNHLTDCREGYLKKYRSEPKHAAHTKKVQDKLRTKQQKEKKEAARQKARSQASE
jgi:hypothetical protein